jgi:virginiamycin B lyase
MIAATLLLAATLAAPKVETFPAPAGQIPTEIIRLGDRMAFISWKNWPTLDPQLGRIDQDGRIKLQPMAVNHMPGLVSRAPDGTIWLSDGKKPVLWHVLTDGKIERVPITLTTIGIAVDPSGAIWATHPEKADISRYSAEGSVMSAWFVGRRYGRSAAPSVKLPPPNKGPIVPKKMDSTRSLTPEERKARNADAEPTWIVAGPDDAMWFTEPKYKAIGRMTDVGDVEQVRLPADWGVPRNLVSAKDSLWFVVTNMPFLGHVSLDGKFSSVALPYPATALAIDSQGRIWFATGAGIGYVDEQGAAQMVEETPRIVRSMAEGPDGAMWFTDQSAKVIGRVR